MKGDEDLFVGLRRNLSLVRRCCQPSGLRTDGRELSMVLFSPDTKDNAEYVNLISEVIMNELNSALDKAVNNTIKVLEQFQKAVTLGKQGFTNDTAATNLNRYHMRQAGTLSVGDERELLAVVPGKVLVNAQASAFLGRECLEVIPENKVRGLVGHDDGVDFVNFIISDVSRKGFEYATAPLVAAHDTALIFGQALAQLNTTMEGFKNQQGSTTTHNGKQVNKIGYFGSLQSAFKAMIDPSVAGVRIPNLLNFQQMSNVASELYPIEVGKKAWQALPKSAREAQQVIHDLLDTLLQHNVTYGILGRSPFTELFKGYTKKRQSSADEVFTNMNAEEYLNDLSSAEASKGLKGRDLENLNLAIAMQTENTIIGQLKISAVKDAYIGEFDGEGYAEKVGEKAESFSTAIIKIIGWIISNGNGFAGNIVALESWANAGKVGLVVLIMPEAVRKILTSNYTRTHQKETRAGLSKDVAVAVESSRPGTIDLIYGSRLILQIDAILDEVRMAERIDSVNQLNLYMQRNEAGNATHPKWRLGEIGEVLRSRSGWFLHGRTERADFMSMEMTPGTRGRYLGNRRSVD
ncbi:hypothetical protein SPFM9_00245 [Salmonella phage SPFM9]|nr:hypothetical protein SPFM9_00245 [Salmonella phage SPFM9]